MKAYLIDPFERTVTEVQYNGEYRHIYELIKADTYTAVQITPQQDVIFLDDEGLYAGEHQRFFLYSDYPQPLAGRGLVLGTDREGESVEPKITLDEVEALVRWAPANLRFDGVTTEEGWVDHPAFGRMKHIRNVPHFRLEQDDDLG